MDRYDELMHGLYAGQAPQWLPAASQPLYERESLRRRSALGQVLRRSFPCTMYCAQSLYSPDFAQEVCSAWPGARFSAGNVTTGLYLTLDRLLKGLPRAAVVDLLHYEGLAVANLQCEPLAARASVDTLGLDASDGLEVYRFDHAVPEFHARMTLYAGGVTPAAFARAYEVPRRTTFIARWPAQQGWFMDEVTPNADGVDR